MNYKILNSFSKLFHPILWNKNSTIVTSIRLKCPLHFLGLWVHNNLSKDIPKEYFSHAVISLNTVMTNNKLILKKLFKPFLLLLNQCFWCMIWVPWLMVIASPASGVVMSPWASLQQSSTINPVAYVSSAEQGHSSASRGTIL